jgi:hypothetical protein
MTFPYVEHAKFPLASSDTRIAIMTGLCGGTVTRAEVEHLTLTDTVRRPYRKPVVVEGIRYNSIAEAADAIITRSKKRMTHSQYRLAHQQQAKSLARRAEVSHSGVYWVA